MPCPAPKVALQICDIIKYETKKSVKTSRRNKSSFLIHGNLSALSPPTLGKTLGKIYLLEGYGIPLRRPTTMLESSTMETRQMIAQSNKCSVNTNRKRKECTTTGLSKSRKAPSRHLCSRQADAWGKMLRLYTKDR